MFINIAPASWEHIFFKFFIEIDGAIKHSSVHSFLLTLFSKAFVSINAGIQHLEVVEDVCQR
jgi:hypothetical protein